MGNVCSKCGHPVSKGALFCSQCGNRLASCSDRASQTVSGHQARVTIAGGDIVNSSITYGDNGELTKKVNLDWLDTSLTDTHVKNGQALVAGLAFFILGIAGHLASVLTVFGVEASTVREIYAQLGWFKYLFIVIGLVVLFTSSILQAKSILI